MKNWLLMVIAAIFTCPLWAANPKYVFLFIGDGMSVPQRMAAEEFALATGKGPLAINHLPQSAITRTCSADSLITDSAAAATAIACGIKTRNSGLGVDAAGERIASCAEVARDNGYKVGVCTTVYLSHATPAGFYAHCNHRGMTEAIALDLGRSGFDFFAGGGLNMNVGQFAPNCEATYNYIQTNGYKIVSNRAEFLALKPGCGKIFTRFTDSSLTAVIDAEEQTASQEPSLEEIVVKGIELLDNERGFFLMCEGGTIDWFCHSNDIASALQEVLAFDQCVKRALEFQEKHPEETLIIVTGDHETGGLALGRTETGYRLDLRPLAAQKISDGAFNVRLGKFLLEHPNITAEEMENFITWAFGFVFEGEVSNNYCALNDAEKQEIRNAIKADLEYHRRQVEANKASAGLLVYKSGRVCRSILARKCGIGWTSAHHTALPVLTTAKGPGSEQIHGFIDNTDIGKLLKEIFSDRHER